MLWCQGAQNIGLCNHKQVRCNVHRTTTLHTRLRQTDRREHRDNSATIRSNERVAR